MATRQCLGSGAPARTAAASPACRPRVCQHNVSSSRGSSAACRASGLAPNLEAGLMPTSILAPGPKPSASYQEQMDNYAVVDVGGQQHVVQLNKWYVSNKLKDTEVGDIVSFGRVLLLKLDGEPYFGSPYLQNVTVEAEILEHYKGPKTIVLKHKRKKNYLKKRGHRQHLTKWMVTAMQKDADFTDDFAEAKEQARNMPAATA